jgi:hypothetical protein
VDEYPEIPEVAGIRFQDRGRQSFFCLQMVVKLRQRGVHGFHPLNISG